jgi:hypothetical protein
MFSPGARDAKTRRAKRSHREATRDTVAGLVDANPAKALVMSHIRQLVAEGRAEWAWHENGDIRLRLQTGETFLLADTAIIRIA